MLIALVSFGFISSVAKEKSDRATRAFSKTAVETSYGLMNANNVTSWARGDGFFNWLVSQSWNGEFPKASGVGTIFAEGIVFGGLVNDGLYTQTLRVTGNTYFVGMRPGSILTDAGGNATGPEAYKDDPLVRVFAVRPDMPLAIQNASASWPDLTNDAATFFQVSSGSVGASQIQTVAEQYFKDWKEWPAKKGAPWYVDTVRVVRNDTSYNSANPHHIPGIPGATKTIWFVCNDLDNDVTSTFGGSPPTGIEQQMTLWAYASSTPLNNIIFRQVKLIYKGNPGAPAASRIDSMYVVQWADGDVGDAGDDFAGSDSLLSLGFEYNSVPGDAKYAAASLAVPATGYAFLQGTSHFTGVASDSAVINFRWVHGYKYWHERPLTAYDYFAAGSSIDDPDDAVYDGTQQWYNLMRGCLPRPQYPAGVPFYSSSTYASANNIVTPYCLSGDPTKGSGWIDGIDLQAGDRRMVNVHGPFTLNLHDTAEVVIALVDGMGSNNISSLQVLKYNTTFAKYAFDLLFDLPVPPPAPAVTATESPNEITLSWGVDSAKVATVENYTSKTFVFEGYNIYQLPTPSTLPKDGYRIATYDLIDPVSVIYNNEVDPKTGYVVNIPAMFGTNSGIKRFIDLKQDYISQRPLVNGQPYYYVVTSYGYDVSGTSPYTYLESSAQVMTITPHSANPGIVIQSKNDEAVPVVHSTGVSTLGVFPTVVSPQLVTGHRYEVTFFATDSSNIDGLDEVTGDPLVYREPNVKWKLRDATKDSVLYTELGFKKTEASIIKDGIQWKLNGIPWYVYGVSKEINSLVYTPSDNLNLVGVNAGLQAFGGGLDIGAFFSGSSLLPSQSLKIMRVEFSNDTTKQQKCYVYLRGGTPNYGYIGYGKFPGRVYDITDPLGQPKQVNVAIVEQNGSTAQDLKWDPTTSNGDREYLAILSSDYDGNQPDTLGRKHINYTSVRLNSGALDIVFELWATLINPGPLFHEGDVMTINANIPPVLSPSTSPAADLYVINTQGLEYQLSNVNAAKAEVEKINVFPNPYYGLNARETNRLNKYVTFNHLPQRATIRIFNLAGISVVNIPKDDATQFARWNLRNANNLPVASGIYIVYVDMPDLGKSKILKLAIIQEEQILPTY